MRQKEIHSAREVEEFGPTATMASTEGKLFVVWGPPDCSECGCETFITAGNVITGPYWYRCPSCGNVEKSLESKGNL